MTTRRGIGALLAALIGGVAVLSLVLMARQDSTSEPSAASPVQPDEAGIVLTEEAGQVQMEGAARVPEAADPGQPDRAARTAADSGAPSFPVTSTIVYSHTFQPTKAFPLARDSVSWSDQVHQGASGIYSIRTPAAGPGATTPEWSFAAVNGPSKRQMSVFAAEPARDRRAETVRDADAPAALEAFVNLGGRPRSVWSDQDWFLAPVQEQPWLEPAAVSRLEAEGAIERAGSDVILGESATAWETSELGTWGVFREARRRVWLTDDGLKVRLQSVDADGAVFATDEARSLARGDMGDPEQHWRSSDLPVRFTRLSGEVPADARGRDVAARAAGAGIPVSATLYVTGTPHSGQLEVVDPEPSWAVVYVPTDDDFAIVVAPADRAPPMWWHSWPGVRQAARSPLVEVDTAGLDLPAEALSLEYPAGGGAMVTWIEDEDRIAVLALDTAEALRIAALLSDAGS